MFPLFPLFPCCLASLSSMAAARNLFRPDRAAPHTRCALGFDRRILRCIASLPLAKYRINI